MSVEMYIKEKVKKISEKVYIAPDIPKKKLNAALKSMAPDLNPNYVVAIIDTSIFGGGKDGGVITGEMLYLHPFVSDTFVLQFSDIVKATYETNEIVKDNGKVKLEESLKVEYKNGKIRDVTQYTIGMENEHLKELINGIIDEAGEEGEFVSTSQATPLSMMDESIKIDYIKIMCNFAYGDDELIDASEYAEILSLMVRIELDVPSRLFIRKYMLESKDHEVNQDIIERLREKIDEGSFELVKKSLMKDIIYLLRSKDRNLSWQDNEFIVNLKDRLDISTDQIEYISETIINDEEILELRKNDSEIKKSMKEIASKATAVGVPLAAIYLSGSVLGVSAAGLTSGLAALGMGGILGFSSMFTGIEMAVLLGVGAYKGVKKVTGISELENNKQRELMIQAIIKNSQKSLNYLIEDLNEITKQLTVELTKGKEAEIKIKKLSSLLSMLSLGAKETGNKIKHAQKESIIIKLPLVLDTMRINELTSEATKKKYRKVIFECYVEKEVTKEDGTRKQVFQLDENLNENTLEQLYSILDAIGYYNMKDAALASAKGVMKGILNNG
ncbi:hypothetical protein [Alkalibacterium kapii]|uniref:ENT domain-containing protein n=1 Tax=Alkalibacterium kapii TaxID=426704 RepID=A0A511AS18_9LACT|nr:hypothetical protein [Alkalibacterium kapii]GEK90994.1 hypothetical protein AKA01nite_06160 [Alkalibacterium kapii]